MTRKITLAAGRIVQGFQDKLYLGNLNARRDWGYAKDYVECMWLILQHEHTGRFRHRHGRNAHCARVLPRWRSRIWVSN